MENRLLFEYSLSDAWQRPVSSIEIYDGGSPSVRFQCGREAVGEASSGGRSIPLDTETAAKIQALLANVHVASIEWLTHVVVMDGYFQRFRYLTGGKETVLSGSNISYCLERPELYPNAVKMIELLDRLAGLLAPLGVDQRCFALTGDAGEAF